MKKVIVLISIISIISLSFLTAQTYQFPGNKQITNYYQGVNQSYNITVPEAGEKSPVFMPHENNYGFQNNYANASIVRWSAIDPSAICNDAVVSGNGLHSFVGWALNSKRVSLYNNLSSTPLWQYMTSTAGSRNYTAISDTGGVLAAGSYRNIMLFNKNSDVPFFNYDLLTNPDTGAAGPLDVTSNGSFLIASANRNDSSWVFGFNKNSTVSAWKFKVAGQIQGVKIAFSDSLAIINTYSGYYVVNTLTGFLKSQGAITGGTQMAQGISGNGNIIALINYQGYLRMYQWNGSAYTLLWQYQEPTGTYYNWVTSVEVSNDGSYVAIGTLIFLTSSSYDGRVRYFKVSTGSTPLWSYSSTGDEISCVALSKNGKILAVTSWGFLDDSKDDIYIFKANPGSNIPVFSVNTPGSPYVCGISDDGTTVTAGGKLVHARMMGSGGTYYNIFVDTNTNPVGVFSGNNEGVPDKYDLQQNYPNPFNPETKIKYSVQREGFVSVKIFDANGREVKTLYNGLQKAGNYEVVFNSGSDRSELGSGIYFCVMKTSGFRKTIKMILIR